MPVKTDGLTRTLFVFGKVAQRRWVAGPDLVPTQSKVLHDLCTYGRHWMVPITWELELTASSMWRKVEPITT